MRIGPIDFPEPLLAAHRSGSLVVFAGAGVSIAPPSNLPDMTTIAGRLAQDSQMRQENGEPVDRFLGRLSDEGVPVHEEVRRIMTDPASKPSPLHYDLLRLFPSASQVRLATTNFDSHFTTAAREIYGDELEIFYAPALPLGHQVDGLVYLHGSVEKDPRRIVLTDNDFGRAYLTEGWARRFLQGLLASYTVLFVGYSHNDPVMNYLARGLPPEVRDLAHHRAARRFALTPEEGPGHWEYVGITPIPYPLVREDNRHAALGEAISGWVRLSRMGALDHEVRIRSIVEKPAPPDGESSDYLEMALEDPEAARIFFRYARTPDWLRWAEESGIFEPLSSPDSADPVASEAAVWLVENFLYQYPGQALGVVHPLGDRMNPVLWQAIVHRLSSQELPRPKPETLALWIALLLGSPQPREQESLLRQLLISCCRPEDEASALLLFEYLSRPRLTMDLEQGQPEGGGGGMPRLMVDTRGDADALRASWDSFFRPNLSTVGKELESILASHLLLARLLLQPASQFAGQGESLAPGGRPSGDSAQADSGLDFLVEAAREVLERNRSAPV